ncbi:MAG: hypothetical protein ACE5LU_00890 [Anaerolineae bacterium]
MQAQTSGEPKTRLSSDERRLLAHTYAPILVLFPERRDLGRPHGGRQNPRRIRGDYHPRNVDIVLDHAYLYPGFRGNLKYPRRLLRFNQAHPWIRPLPEFLRRLFPEPEPNAKDELPKIVRGDADIALASVLDLVGIGRDRTAAQRAWEHYFDILDRAEDDRYRSRVYARAIQGDEVIEWTLLDRLRWYSELLATVDEIIRQTPEPFPQIANEIEAFLEEVEESIEEFVTGLKMVDGDPRDVAVQYWFLYYYNDWHNRHEVDWEGITIILKGDPDGAVTPANLSPEIVGYASHVSGRRRPWTNVETESSHPIVYCARGSHASYFGCREDGYAAGLPISVKIPWINVSITTQVSRGDLGYRDWVANSSDHPEGAARLYPGGDYDVQLLPNLDPRRRRFTEEDIDTLYWLMYPGLWGDRPLFSIGGSGPQGPLWQGLKSDNPFEWVRRKCVADDMYSP